MSFVKMVRVVCDGPDCTKQVYGDNLAEARRYAKYGLMWPRTAKYGLDLCSQECSDKWEDRAERQKKRAVALADAQPGTLDLATVKVVN